MDFSIFFLFRVDFNIDLVGMLLFFSVNRNTAHYNKMSNVSSFYGIFKIFCDFFGHFLGFFLGKK